MHLVKAASLVVLGFMTLASSVWGVLAIIYALPDENALRYVLVALFVAGSLTTLLALRSDRRRWFFIAAYAALFALLMTWWSSSTPSNARDWQADVAVLPFATIEGDMVTVHNIRNFDYRSETDYTPAYYDKKFDLRQLDTVDVIASYWMGPHIAHIFMSFGFTGGDRLAISIETRKEKSEGYSTIKGFFRQYELYYVVADERDVIRLRTNYRRDPPEDVYVYRTTGPAGSGRLLFLEYLAQMNALKTTPEFYNSLTTNCTTAIWLNSRVNPAHLPFSWELVASGHVPEYLYKNRRLETGGLSFSELQRRAHVNSRAQAADAERDFSQRIRNDK